MTPKLQQIVDKESIISTVALVARGEDRRNAAILRRAYCKDATVDFGIFAGTFEDYLAWVVPGAEVVTNTQHMLGQSHIELTDAAAKVETHVVSYHRIEAGDAPRDVVIGGRYLDVLERRGEEWRITSRTMLYDWVNDWGESANWAHGVMGAPFSDPRFSGRAKGDWSEAFFSGD